MPIVEDSGLVAEIAVAMESSAQRLRAARGELDRALADIEAALVLARRAPAPGRDLERLLEAQRDTIVRAVVEAIGTGEAPPAAARFGFRLDPVERAAKIGRRRVPLTESEYKVLEALWEQMPAPVSRQALLDRLYRGRGETTDAVIDMFIFKIRSKLRSAGCTDAAIRAIRGLGWVLELEEGVGGEDEGVSPRPDRSAV